MSFLLFRVFFPDERKKNRKRKPRREMKKLNPGKKTQNLPKKLTPATETAPGRTSRARPSSGRYSRCRSARPSTTSGGRPCVSSESYDFFIFIFSFFELFIFSGFFLLLLFFLLSFSPHLSFPSFFRTNPPDDHVKGMGVDPRSMAQRIMDIRSQLAKEWVEDLSDVSEENALLLRESAAASLAKSVAEHPFDSSTDEEESGGEEGGRRRGRGEVGGRGEKPRALRGGILFFFLF